MNPSLKKFALVPQIIALILMQLTIPSCANFQSTAQAGFDDDLFIDEAITPELVQRPLVVQQPVTEQQPDLSLLPPKNRPIYASSRDYWKMAMNEMQKGNEEDARWALEQALLLEPQNKIANKLKKQLDTDAIFLLGENSIEYQVQTGDSLSKLAKLYLNDAFLFYALAKYNSMDDPGKLFAGQKIRIPVSEIEAAEIVFNLHLEEQGKQQAALIDASSSELLLAQEQYENKNFQQVILMLENSEGIATGDMDLTEILVLAYYEQSFLLLENQERKKAKDLLLKAAALIPDHVKVNIALINMQEKNHNHAQYEKALDEAKNGNLIHAYDLLQQVLITEPDFESAIHAQHKIKIELVDSYYRQALMLQRKQELEKSIEIWDKLLHVDAQNENALLYRAKAVELKSKLEKLASRQ